MLRPERLGSLGPHVSAEVNKSISPAALNSLQCSSLSATMRNI